VSAARAFFALPSETTGNFEIVEAVSMSFGDHIRANGCRDPFL
jgi:hypothetical protein